MKKIKLTAILAILAMCFALVAGCSGNNAAPPAAGQSSGSADASDMDYIKNKGKMTIGYTVFEPMNYTDANGRFTGFDTEFALAVCAALGVDPDFVEINWDTKEIELEAKSIDCVWNGMTITPERAANMSITLPYVKNAQVIVVKAPGTVRSTADLIGKTVAAEIGSAGEMQITGSEDEDPDENLAQANYVGMTKQTDCLVEVKAGTADACVLDWTLAKTMVGEGTDFADLVIVSGIELAEEEYGVAFRKGSDVTGIVDGIITELVRDGTLPALADKYELSLSPSVSVFAPISG